MSAELAAAPPPADKPPYRAPWPAILGLIGLDYFSTIAYQPSIAAEGAGVLAPLATAGLVLLTCLGVLPVYAYVAGRSPPGQGSIALLEKRLAHWRGKLLLLIVLGFAATNFVFTRTLSTADAAVHIVNNPSPVWQETLDRWGAAGGQLRDLSDHFLWQRVCEFWNRQMVTTLLLLLVNFAFWPLVWYGFTRRTVYAAVVVVGFFLLLTAVIFGSGLLYLAQRPELFEAWWAKVRAGAWGVSAPAFAGTDDWGLVKAVLWLLPKVALGLSGFEMSLVLMPLVRGRPADNPLHPAGQIANTRKLLVTSAAVMGLLLIGSALVTTLLMVPQSLLPGGGAHERALAYIAHGGRLADGLTGRDLNPLFGPVFGTVYDVSTILVLTLAGVSVTVGMKTLMPQFLLRLGMELRWAYAIGLIYQIFNAINLVVTIVFRASVEAQRAAYAMSVLAVMTAAAFAVALDLRHRGGFLNFVASVPFALVTLLLLAMTFAVVWGHPGSVLIAGLFVVTVVGTSLASRWWRAKEFRCEGFDFPDDATRELWDKMRALHLSVLVPHRPGGATSLAEKEAKIRQRHRIDSHVPLIFLEIEVEDASAFSQRPIMHIREENGQYFVKVTHCASVAHVIVALGLEFSKVGEPPEIHFGWSDEHPLAATLKFVLFGQGNIPLLVNDLLRRHAPDVEKRPRVVIG